LTEALAAEHAHGLVRGNLDPAYVAPEVTAGLQPTPATDVWSVGALLFHAMAGHAPFKHSPDPPARLRRAGWLGPLVEMALSPDPADRPNMAEVAAYLKAREVSTVAGAPEPTIPLAPPPPPPLPVLPVEAKRRTGLIALVLAALVLTLALIVGILILGHHTNHAPLAGPQHPTTHHASPAGKSASGHKTRPTAAAMTAFARRYVATASTDPNAGFAMLTPAYRRASPRYRQFWSSIRDPRIVRITAHPQLMTVTYTYRYRFAKGHQHRATHTETVQLDLVQHNGHLLIAGAA
jgi:serine/threonine protein kinase